MKLRPASVVSECCGFRGRLLSSAGGCNDIVADGAGAYSNVVALLADANQFLGMDVVRFGENTNIILSRRMLEKQSVLVQLRGAMEVLDDYCTYEEIAGLERVQREFIP